MCSWGGHQLPILQLHAEFDLTQNPISVIITEDFTVGATLAVETYSYSLTVGKLYYEDMLSYQNGYYSGSYGSISPSTFKGVTIMGINAMTWINPSTTGYYVNSFSVILSGNVTSSIPNLTVTINGTSYTLTGSYNSKNNRTEYAYSFGTSSSATNPIWTYFNNNAGKTVTVTLK